MGAARHVVRVCKGLSCQGRFADDLYDLAKERVDGFDAIAVESCTCQNQCESGPNVIIDRVIYHEMATDRITGLLDDLLDKCRSA